MSGSCVDGEPVAAERFVEAYGELTPYVELVDERQSTSMSFFEVIIALAFAIFADAPVDVAVVEVGVGGGLDCTNSRTPRSRSSPRSLDHTQ